MDPHNPYYPSSEFLGTWSGEIPFELSQDPNLQQDSIESAYTTADEAGKAELIVQLNALYDEELLGLDQAIELLLTGLEERQLARDTLIILTADHGESLYDAPGEVGHGATLRQEIMAIPLMFYSPGLMEESRTGCLSSVVDLLPTMAGLLGIAPPAEIEGLDLRQNCQEYARALMHTYNGQAYNISEVAAVSENARLVRNCQQGTLESVDLISDPLGLTPSAGVSAEAQPLQQPLEELLTRALDRWPEQHCNGFQ
jgi:arylsulfatase A-like enzyme